MKNLMYFVMAAFLVTACGSNEHSAQKLIKEQMKNIVSNYTNYKSISFGGLDSLYTTYQKDSTYVQLMRKADTYTALENQQTQNAIMAKTVKATKAIKTLVDAYADSAKMATSQANQYAQGFRKSFAGWQMSHTFSVQDAQGAEQILTYKFYFDKPLNNLVGWEKE